MIKKKELKDKKIHHSRHKSKPRGKKDNQNEEIPVILTELDEFNLSYAKELRLTS